MVTALYKYYRFVFFVLVSVLISSFVSACGAEVPRSFVYTSDNELHYVSWEKSGDNGAISGTAIFQTYNTNYYNKERVKVQQIGFLGTQKEKVLTIQYGALWTRTGTIEQQQLLINTTNGSGQSVSETWYAVPKETYNQLATAFNGHANVRYVVEQSQEHLEQLPYDAEPYKSKQKVNQAQRAIESRQDAIKSVKDSSRTSFLGPCYTLGYVSDVSNDAFTISSEDRPTFETFHIDKKNIEDEWKITRQLAVPDVSFPLPWRFRQAEVDASVNAIMLKQQEVLNQMNDHSKELERLHKRYDELSKEVQNLKKQYKCSSQ